MANNDHVGRHNAPEQSISDHGETADFLGRIEDQLGIDRQSSSNQGQPGGASFSPVSRTGSSGGMGGGASISPEDPASAGS